MRSRYLYLSTNMTESFERASYGERKEKEERKEGVVSFSSRQYRNTKTLGWGEVEGERERERERKREIEGDVWGRD